MSLLMRPEERLGVTGGHVVRAACRQGTVRRAQQTDLSGPRLDSSSRPPPNRQSARLLHQPAWASRERIIGDLSAHQSAGLITLSGRRGSAPARKYAVMAPGPGGGDGCASRTRTDILSHPRTGGRARDAGLAPGGPEGRWAAEPVMPEPTGNRTRTWSGNFSSLSVESRLYFLEIYCKFLVASVS